MFRGDTAIKLTKLTLLKRLDIELRGEKIIPTLKVESKLTDGITYRLW